MRARIVEGAAELIRERGVNGTSLDDVRKVVGASGSQISHYFADKQELIRQVVEARTAYVVDFHRQPKLGRLDDLCSLRAWADLWWIQAGPAYLRNGCIYGSLTVELLEADDATLDVLAQGYDRWLGMFVDGLSAMRAHGDLIATADARHLAVALVAAHQGSALVTHVTKSAEPYRVVADAALDYVASFAPHAEDSAGGGVSRSSRLC
jgi:AcrR family transcriptional regulator